jgi:hypothetical protein
VQSRWSKPTFQSCILLPSSGRSPWSCKQYVSPKRRSTSTRLHGTISQRLVEVNRRFRGAYCLRHQDDPSDRGSSTHLWNVGQYQRDYMVLYPRRL